MDGVVSDFESGFKILHPKVKMSDLSRDELRVYKREFAKNKFFANLPVVAGAKKFVESLVKMGHDVEILTAVSEFDSKENANQKAQWVRKNLGVYKFNWVQKAKEKAKFAGPNILLIDDRDKSVVPFKQAGGLIIKHTKFSDTLKKIKMIKESKPMKSYKEFISEAGDDEPATPEDIGRAATYGANKWRLIKKSAKRVTVHASNGSNYLFTFKNGGYSRQGSVIRKKDLDI